MPKKAFFEGDNSDGFDFILNALKKNSEDLDAILNEVKKMTDQAGEIYETTFKRIEEKMNSLQNDVRNLTKSALAAPQQARTPSLSAEVTEPKHIPHETLEARSPPVVLRCKSWEDFQAFASQAETVSFEYRESDNNFEADALKDNQIVAYVGQVPKQVSLLKLWLSRQLELPEAKVFEGTLTRA